MQVPDTAVSTNGVRKNRIRLEDPALHAAIVAGILYLKGHGWTNEQIGVACGYPDGGMIDKIINRAAMPSPRHLAALSALLSDNGYDELGRHFASKRKTIVLCPAGIRTNGSTHDEVIVIADSIGLARHEEHGGCLHRAMEYWDRVGLAYFTARKEIEQKIRRRIDRDPVNII